MDVRNLKDYILENNLIEEILKSIQCHHIKYHSSGYYTCGNKDGNNISSILVRCNDYLTCINYTRQIVKVNRSTDLIDLVCFNQNLSFSQGLKFLCNTVGIDYYHDFDLEIPESLRITQMLLDMNSNKYDEKEIPLKPISKEILNYYKPYVNDMFFNDNIGYKTQKDFNVGYDDFTNRITIPVFSELGDLVGVKGRLFKEELDENDLKYLYIEPCPRAKVLFGLNKTENHIKEKQKVYVVEAEKGVMQLWEMGYCNVVATGGKELSMHQIEMLTRLGVDIVFAFDADVTKQEIEELSNKFVDNIPIYYIFDEDNILNEKESPTDNPNKWRKLVTSNVYKIK